MTLPDSENPNLSPMETAPSAASNISVEKNIVQEYGEVVSDLQSEIPPGFKPESEKHNEYKQRLEELHQKQLETALSEDEQVEVDDMKKKIDSLLIEANESVVETEKSPEAEIIDESADPKTIERLARDVRLISDVEQLESLEPAPGDDENTFKHKLDRKREITAMIERRNWGKVFGKLQEGDKVVTVLVPGADFLKIKHLNDEIFGYSRTSDVLEHRKKLIEEQLVKDGGNGAEILKTDYQSSTIKIPSGSVPEDYVSDLNGKLKNIDTLMTSFIENIVKEELEKSKNDPVKSEKLNKFRDELLGHQTDGHVGRSGYRMTFGIADVGAETMAGRLDALNQSTQAARTVRGIEGSYGAEYSGDLVDQELDAIKNLRGELQDESITNSDGISFKLFSKDKNGFLKLNRDVLRDVRKDKFKADKNSEKILGEVTKYVKKINIIDSVKPFVKEEAEEGGVLQKQMKDYSDLTDDFLNLTEKAPDDSLTAEEKDKKKQEAEKVRREIGEIIKTEEKDHNYSSADQFHSKATEIKKCAYLSLDVIDVGVDQLLEFDRLLQEAEIKGGGKSAARRELLDQKASEAGDETTQKMREVRANIKKVLGKHGLLTNVGSDEYGEEGIVLGLVGGDEITLAIDTTKLEKGLTIEKLMFEIKDATNHGKADVRMIKTVAAEATRDNTSVDKQSQTELFKGHLKTIKKAEKGAEIAKHVEENVRKLNLMIEKQGDNKKVTEIIKEAGLEKIFKLEKGAIKSFIVVMEKDNGFDVKAEDLSVDAEELQEKIDEMRRKLVS